METFLPRTFPLFPEEILLRKQRQEWVRQEAYKKIYDRVRYYMENKKILPEGKEIKGVSITGAKSRWGSCSGKNKINFSWRLALCPEIIVDYVVVHELCHVIHKNHGKQFWEMVKENFPEYLLARKWLKSHGRLLLLEI